jgi:uridine kinase
VTERVAGLILAGGRSSRFGRDKLAEPIDGRPMLHHVIDAVRGVVTEVIVVAAPGSTPALLSNVRLVHDPRAFEGPLAGLATGFAQLDPAVERVIVVGGDMPSLVPGVLGDLIKSLDGHDAAVLADDRGPRPLPMAARRSAIGPVVERLLDDGERRLRALLHDADIDVDVIPPRIWRRNDPDAATLLDVDVVADLPMSPERRAVVAMIADATLRSHPRRRVIVAIDGVDGAGKTVFGDELAEIVRPRRPVVRATIDRFHRPRAQRYARGRTSPEGFYRDSFDLEALHDRLLEPFEAGQPIVTGVFDHVTDRLDIAPTINPSLDAVLILDGIFLHRPELAGLWDLSVFLDVDFDVSIPRGALRDGSDPDPTAPANRRYVDGQRLYLDEADPKAHATFVIDNSDLAAPRIIHAPADLPLDR